MFPFMCAQKPCAWIPQPCVYLHIKICVEVMESFHLRGIFFLKGVHKDLVHVCPVYYCVLLFSDTINKYQCVLRLRAAICRRSFVYCHKLCNLPGLCYRMGIYIPLVWAPRVSKSQGWRDRNFFISFFLDRGGGSIPLEMCTPQQGIWLGIKDVNLGTRRILFLS